MTKELVLSGGGCNGSMAIGALAALNTLLAKNWLADFDMFTGTSIGAFISFCLCIGLDLNEIHVFFVNHTSTFATLEIDAKYMYQNRAVGTLNLFRTLMRKEIQARFKKPRLTFAELYQLTAKKLNVCCVCVNNAQPYFFSNAATPEADVCEAVVSSMSVPFLFPCVEIGGSLFVDGGLVNNFPIFYESEEKTDKFGVWIKRNSAKASTHSLQEDWRVFLRQTIKALFFASDRLTENRLLEMKQKYVTLSPTESTILPAKNFNVQAAYFSGFAQAGLCKSSSSGCLVLLVLMMLAKMPQPPDCKS